MAMERVPEYLVDVLEVTDLGFRSAGVYDPDDLMIRLSRGTESLGVWIDDDEYWSSLSVDEYFATEVRVLTRELHDQRHTLRIMEEQAQPVDFARKTRSAVQVVRDDNLEFINGPSRRGDHLGRSMRLLRRTFKAAGGGVLIAADLLAPDPTLIVKVASVLGGIDMILDAAKPE